MIQRLYELAKQGAENINDKQPTSGASSNVGEEESGSVVEFSEEDDEEEEEEEEELLPRSSVRIYVYSSISTFYNIYFILY